MSNLKVWHGPMPESNGRQKWSAVLYREDQKIWDGYIFDRSEYPDRVRYEADCMRFMLGLINKQPDIMEYDADLHSGYRECPCGAGDVNKCPGMCAELQTSTNVIPVEKVTQLAHKWQAAKQVPRYVDGGKVVDCAEELLSLTGATVQ